MRSNLWRLNRELYIGIVSDGLAPIITGFTTIFHYFRERFGHQIWVGVPHFLTSFEKMTKSLSRLGSSISRIHVLTRSAPVFGVYDFCFASKAGSGVLHANAENRRVFKPACFRRLFLTSGEHLLQISFSHFSKCRSPRLPFLKMVTFLEYLV